MCIPFVHRSQQDMEAGLRDMQDLFSELGVTVLSMEEVHIPCPFSSMRRMKPAMTGKPYTMYPCPIHDR